MAGVCFQWKMKEAAGGLWEELCGGGGEGNSAQLKMVSCKNLPTDENVGV